MSRVEAIVCPPGRSGNPGMPAMPGIHVEEFATGGMAYNPYVHQHPRYVPRDVALPPADNPDEPLDGHTMLPEGHPVVPQYAAKNPGKKLTNPEDIEKLKQRMLRYDGYR